ncbi:uncharacterized protein BCR38DRAFT_525680 [Pseudomassariella vexata]|uniref:Clr5 domain-containing protein n=1 Tax=Pseudomassariella vexata TaxID=1141098 RepID=A0A1Y2DPM5_9PEZI|nr:uncharacterized protein BCR38DRAFT_525680 [Pseudomassariella vexata]ORY61242.1 hypothetical protein BCR38DRAFT_525680 [Pseudomassariella vexata]
MTKPWDTYEATIKSLYTKHTLSTVRQIMLQEYGFKASDFRTTLPSHQHTPDYDHNSVPYRDSQNHQANSQIVAYPNDKNNDGGIVQAESTTNETTGPYLSFDGYYGASVTTMPGDTPSYAYPFQTPVELIETEALKTQMQGQE